MHGRHTPSSTDTTTTTAGLGGPDNQIQAAASRPRPATGSSRSSSGMVDHYRLPMASAALHTYHSAPPSAGPLASGRRREGTSHSLATINQASIHVGHVDLPRAIRIDDGQAPRRGGQEALPGFTELFGPREALPPPGPRPILAPAPLRVSLLPEPAFETPGIVHGVDGGGHVRPLAPLRSQSTTPAPPPKRKSDAFEERDAHDPPTKRSRPGARLGPGPGPIVPLGAGGGGAATVALFDVCGIRLEGEESDAVPVFDTCDMVRRKIRAFLARPGVTQAAFLRAAASVCSDGRRFQGAQLNRFLSMRGPNSGNTCGIFYAAYVFLEKVRIRDGRPKSSDRVEMERQHRGGFNVTEIRNYITAFKGERVGFDKYGKVWVDGPGDVMC